jgi:hypothetical protein
MFATLAPRALPLRAAFNASSLQPTVGEHNGPHPSPFACIPERSDGTPGSRHRCF